jgi:hypothetical protein
MVKRSIGRGISQSGNFARLVAPGFNQAEGGEAVHDGCGRSSPAAASR